MAQAGGSLAPMKKTDLSSRPLASALHSPSWPLRAFGEGNQQRETLSFFLFLLSVSSCLLSRCIVLFFNGDVPGTNYESIIRQWSEQQEKQKYKTYDHVQNLGLGQAY